MEVIIAHIIQENEIKVYVFAGEKSTKRFPIW
jgi:hypothetical protein